MTSIPFIEIAQETGVEVIQDGDAIIWQGPAAGKRKPKGPLAGKTIGLPVASEFSDFQAYYLALYITELGGKVEFLAADWIRWKHTRPTVSSKGVQGMWGLSIDPIPTMGAERQGCRPLREAKPEDYAALIILGGHSADLLLPETEVLELINSVASQNGVIGAIGSGSLPLINAGILNGKRCTGNNVVSYMLEKIGQFENEPVVADGKVITAQDTVDSPLFIQEMAQIFDPTYPSERKGILGGKRILIIAGEDFEDVELVVPVMEFLYRGADVTLATFPPPLRARPPLLGLEVVVGNFGVSVPLQEIPDHHYGLTKLADLQPDAFDLVMIPGAFCPWNMVAAGEPIEWLKRAYQAGILIAPICHGAIPVAAADLVKGRKVTGCGQVQTSIRIMEGEYNKNWSAVIDGQIVSGRVPSDVPEFMDAISAALLV